MFEHVGQPAGVTARAKSLRRRMNGSEQRLWRELRKLDANIRRQAPIGRYIADFASHGRKLVIEVDGGIHRRIAEVAERDIERERWLEGQGYRVLRLTDDQVQLEIDVVLEMVEHALALPLDGGGLGGGEGAEPGDGCEWAPTPILATRPDAEPSPPSPALPPSRRKGE